MEAHSVDNDSINNIRRRVAELPALSEEQYNAQNIPRVTIHRPKDNEPPTELRNTAESEIAPEFTTAAEVEIESSETVPSTQCLFCNFHSATLDENVAHMSSQHGLFIPSPEQLLDLESFLNYLATIIFDYNECLYCGLEKSSVDGVQTHMRDKGHCMINMSAESELLDFWDLSDGEEDRTGAIKLSETEWRLPSGAVINSRSDVTQLRTRPGLTHSRTKGSQHRSRRDELRSITAAENSDTTNEGQHQPSQSRARDNHIAIRNEMGLIGVSENQKRALQATEHKMKKRESLAKAATRHAMEQAPVLTKYYKVYSFDSGVLQ